MGDQTSIQAHTPAHCLGADLTAISKNLGEDRAVDELNASLAWKVVRTDAQKIHTIRARAFTI